MNPADRIAVQPDTLHRDYILTDYEPVASPEGRLQPQSLLRHLLREQGWLEDVWPVCEALIAHLGPDETVWGAKWGPRGFALELYVYNRTENQPPAPTSVGPCLKALESLLGFESQVDETLPYFMWSFEVDPGAVARGRGDDVRLYLGTGETLRKPGGFSLRMGASGQQLENHYAFYDPHTELADVLGRLSHSPRSGGKRDWALLLPAFLRDCHTICYAVKPRHDGLYFARLRTPQLVEWLTRHKIPLAGLLTAHAEDFAHLCWDLGFDFASRGDKVHIDKFAIHGIF